jgi:hypothetical protein
MTQEQFKDLIEAPVNREKEFWNRISIKCAISRTLRLTLQYPDFAQQYLDSLPKVVNENIPTCTDKNQIIK